MAHDGNNEDGRTVGDGKDDSLEFKLPTTQGLFMDFHKESGILKTKSLTDLPTNEDEISCSGNISLEDLSGDQISEMQEWMNDTDDHHRIYSFLTTSLKTLLSLYCPEYCHTNMDNPQILIQVLQNSLRDLVNKVKMQEEKLSQIENEVEEVQVLTEARHSALSEDHKNRLQRLITDYDKQLSTAEERAINSRRQATTLQLQLTKALSKIQELEAQNLELEQNYGTRQMDELTAKNNCLITLVANLKEKLHLRDNELKECKEMFFTLQEKNATHTALEKNYMEELETELAEQRALTETLHTDLEQEKETNIYLWSETSKQMQEIAILKSQLDSSQAEVTHRNHLLENLRQEILHSVVNALPKVLVKASENDAWISSMQLAVNNKECERIKVSRKLAESELELSELTSLLQSKRIKLREFEEELELTDNRITQVAKQLNVKKDLLKRLAADLKVISKSVASCLQKCNEKNQDLEMLKDEEKRKNYEAQEIMNRSQEIKRKTLQVLSHIKCAEEENKQLAGAFEQIKKHEEDLYGKCLLKQSHLDHLTKLLLSKVKLIKELENEIADSNSITKKLLHQCPSPALEKDSFFTALKVTNDNKAPTSTPVTVSKLREMSSIRESDPVSGSSITSESKGICAPANVRVDSSVTLSSHKDVADSYDKPISIQKCTNFHLKNIPSEAKKPSKKSRKKLLFPRGPVQGA